MRAGRLLDGFLTTQLLYVAAKLGVADVLAGGPRTGAEVAAAVGADPDLLTRVLRGLALEDVLEERDGGRFARTEVGACLRSDVAGSLRGPLIVRGSSTTRRRRDAGRGPARRDGLRAGLRGPVLRPPGRPPRAAGRLPGVDDRAVRAGGRGRGRSLRLRRLGRLVDVGGGYGILLGAVLRSAPELRAVLVDQPAVVEQARRRLEAEGVAGRCELVAGDFSSAVPAGADTGLRVERVVPTASPAGLSVIEAVPAT